MSIIISSVIAVSLSMDAFSLALSIGTLDISKKKSIILSLIVGIFHFFMPIIGSFIGHNFIYALNINTHFLAGIIFFYIAIQMIKEYKSEEIVELKMKLFDMIVFAFGVSLDSFGVGFTLDANILYLMKTTIIFSLFSAIFTYLGLSLGKRLNKIIGDYAIILGAIIMLILALMNFVNFICFH